MFNAVSNNLVTTVGILVLDVSLFQVEENVKLALCGVRLQEGVLKFLDDSSFLNKLPIYYWY